MMCDGAPCTFEMSLKCKVVLRKIKTTTAKRQVQHAKVGV